MPLSSMEALAGYPNKIAIIVKQQGRDTNSVTSVEVKAKMASGGHGLHFRSKSVRKIFVCEQRFSRIRTVFVQCSSRYA